MYINFSLERRYQLTELFPTGQHIVTITSSPELAMDEHGEEWFLKDDHIQGLQLAFLQRIGLPVPDVHLLEDGRVATRRVGVDLNTALCKTENPEEVAQMMRKAGLLLTAVHERLRFYDHITDADSWMLAAPNTTARPMENFLYRFVEGGSEATNAMTGELPETAAKVRDKLMSIVKKLAEDTSDQKLFDLLTDWPEVAYGDYKAANIVHQQETGELFLIDPLVHRGNRMSDVAKFITRICIEPHQVGAQEIPDFVAGYRQGVLGTSFNEHQASWFIALDAVNILSSYLGRLAKKDLSFYIVKHLAFDEDYARKICSFLEEAYATAADSKVIKPQGGLHEL